MTMTPEEIAAGGFFCQCSPWDVTAGAEDGNRCPRCHAYASAADERAAAEVRAQRRARALAGSSCPRGPLGEVVDDHDAAYESWVDYEPEPPEPTDESASARADADAADRWIDEYGGWESLMTDLIERI